MITLLVPVGAVKRMPLSPPAPVVPAICTSLPSPLPTVPVTHVLIAIVGGGTTQT
jgi:hypothetical protein